MAIILWFINSTPGRIVLGVAAFLIWLTLHDAKVADRAREGYVTAVERDALASQLNEERRLRDLALNALSDAEKLITASERAEAQAEVELAADIEERRNANLGKPSWSITDDDVRFILRGK